MVLDLDSFDIMQQGRIPLQRKVTLTWLGWSSEGVRPFCLYSPTATMFSTS
jgi:hypothetical protein